MRNTSPTLSCSENEHDCAGADAAVCAEPSVCAGPGVCADAHAGAGAGAGAGVCVCVCVCVCAGEHMTNLL